MSLPSLCIGISLILIFGLILDNSDSNNGREVDWENAGKKMLVLKHYYDKGYCFAGSSKVVDLKSAEKVTDIFTGRHEDKNPQELGNKLVTVMNLPYSCSFSHKKKPILLDEKMNYVGVYFPISPDYSDTKVATETSQPVYKRPAYVQNISSPNIHQQRANIVEPEHFVKRLAVDDSDGLIEITAQSSDISPIMLNFGITWPAEGSEQELGIVFTNNDVLLSGFDVSESELILVDLLHRVSKVTKVMIYLDGTKCHVWADNQSIVILENCNLKNNTLTVSSHDNGTNTEVIFLN